MFFGFRSKSMNVGRNGLTRLTMRLISYSNAQWTLVRDLCVGDGCLNV